MDEIVIKKLDNFFARYKKVSLKKGAIIIRAGEEITKIYYLKNGLVRQYLITPDGQEVTLTLFKPIAYFPLMIAMSKKQTPYYFEAVTPLTMYACPLADIIAFIKQEPDVLFDLTHRFADGLNGLLLKIENMLFENAYAKIISLLLYLGEKFGKKENGVITITLPLTHNDLASMVGLQRETVSRQIEKLAKQGIIDNQKHLIRIVNMQKLKEEVSLFHPA